MAILILDLVLPAPTKPHAPPSKFQHQKTTVNKKKMDYIFHILAILSVSASFSNSQTTDEAGTVIITMRENATRSSEMTTGTQYTSINRPSRPTLTEKVGLRTIITTKKAKTEYFSTKDHPQIESVNHARTTEFVDDLLDHEPHEAGCFENTTHFEVVGIQWHEVELPFGVAAWILIASVAKLGKFKFAKLHVLVASCLDLPTILIFFYFQLLCVEAIVYHESVKNCDNIKYATRSGIVWRSAPISFPLIMSH